MNKKMSQFFGMLCGLVFATFSFANVATLTNDGLALSGYDAVSFFADTPRQGEVEHSYTYNNATYLFSSLLNLEKFKAEPNKYIPQYGGYCAFGVSLGKKFSIDPMAYEVQEDKLYLLLNGATKKVWETNKVNNIIVADKNWTDIANVAPTALEDK